MQCAPWQSAQTLYAAPLVALSPGCAAHSKSKLRRSAVECAKLQIVDAMANPDHFAILSDGEKWRADHPELDTSEAWTADIRRTRHIGDFTGWDQHSGYITAFWVVGTGFESRT
jgi:hypothetical protein